MLVKIKRQECFNKFDKFPQGDEEKELFIYPKTFKSYILTLPAKTIRGYDNHLGSELTGFADYFGFRKLIFLGDSNQYWLRQYSTYKPVKAAYDYLVLNKINKRFNGGIEVEHSELKVFIKNLFWLIRCNAAFPDVYFMDDKQTFLMFICKYGSVHIDVLNKSKNKRLDEFILGSKFQVLENEMCSEPFSNTGAIKGRQTIL